MTAGHSTHRLSNGSLAAAPLAALLAGTLLAGGVIGAVITQGLGSTTTDAAAIGAAQPAATFDAITFRADERAPLLINPPSRAYSTEHRDRLGGP
jgi:hypothetical protein